MTHPINDFMAQRALIDEATYQALYRRSVEDPDGLLGRAGRDAAGLAAPLADGFAMQTSPSRPGRLVRGCHPQRLPQLH